MQEIHVECTLIYIVSGQIIDHCGQPLEIFVDDETKLTLHGLQQHYVKLEESAKNRKLNDLLDTLEFNQVRLRFSDHGLDLPDPGRHLREICRSVHRARQAAGLMQLPEYQYPLRLAAGRTVG